MWCVKTLQTHCLSAPMLSMLASPMATSSCVLPWLYCTTPTRDSPDSNCWEKQKTVWVRYLRKPSGVQKSCTKCLHDRVCYLSSVYSRQKEHQQEWRHMVTSSVSQPMKQDPNPGFLTRWSQQKPLSMLGGKEQMFSSQLLPFFHCSWLCCIVVVVFLLVTQLFASTKCPTAGR